jgi:hypothetical protein
MFIDVKDSNINERSVSNLLSDCTPFSLSFTGFEPQNGTVYFFMAIGVMRMLVKNFLSINIIDFLTLMQEVGFFY